MRKTWAIFGLILALTLSGPVTASTAARMDMEPGGKVPAVHDCPDMASGMSVAQHQEPCTLKCALACHYLSTLLNTPTDAVLSGNIADEHAVVAVRVADEHGPQVPTPPPDFD